MKSALLLGSDTPSQLIHLDVEKAEAAHLVVLFGGLL